MLFNSYGFIVFFPIAVIVYFLLPKRISYLWLLAASYYFYMGWNAKYALLLLASTIITYVCGVLIQWLNDRHPDKLRICGSGRLRSVRIRFGGTTDLFFAPTTPV